MAFLLVTGFLFSALIVPLKLPCVKSYWDMLDHVVHALKEMMMIISYLLKLKEALAYL